MNDKLQNGNRVITTDLFYFEPKNGDIVTFSCSNYIKSNTMLYIKRVIASKGSKVTYNPEKQTISVNWKKEVYDINCIEYGRIYLTSLGKYNVFELNEISIDAWLSYDIKNEFIMPEEKF